MPFFDYLALYQDQTTRYNYLIEKVNHLGTSRDPSLYDQTRLAFATHNPMIITKLYISMPSLEKLVDCASQFSNLRRLEIYSPRKDIASDSLVKFIQEHRITNLNTLQELSLIMPEEWHHIETEPLSLYNWISLRKLDLTRWRKNIDWNSLPKKNLIEFGFNAQEFPELFDFGSFFGSFINLDTLTVMAARESSFDWVLGKTSLSILPKLTTLVIGGNHEALTTCLANAIDMFSESLSSLTIILQEPSDYPFARRSLTWTKPLPRLKRLTIKDKAVFEFDQEVMKQCPSLRSLTLHVDAERSNAGCIDQAFSRSPKWIVLQHTFKELASSGENLEELCFEGTWIISEPVLLEGILSLKKLQQLRFAGDVQKMTYSGLSNIVSRLNNLKFLEVGRNILTSARISSKLRFTGLEVRLGKDTYFSDDVDYYESCIFVK
ncbi:hypothetical protein BGZ49_007247 [Haplosporangium sp. Z 27]|nr:hypothetical protein BGZ49_007247 [Haplosporangium sp. Z 27]